ncbi:MAG: CotH kinase family protein [Clostridia bacterium]|nr:CotH kinase family protein [Clostridia bacterium]
MNHLIFKDRCTRRAVLLAAFFAAAMILCCGCGAQKTGTDGAGMAQGGSAQADPGQVDPGRTDAGQTHAGTAGTEPGQADTTHAEPGHTGAADANPEADRGPAADVDPALYAELVISKIYGNGGKAAAACEHSFIELTNTGAAPLEIGDLALFYKTAGNAAYASFRLPNVTLDGGKSFLIRGASAAKQPGEYQSAGEVIRVLDFDAEWNIALSGKDMALFLAPAAGVYDAAVPPEELDGVISYFAATDNYHFDTGYVDGLSGNVAAIRTAMKQDSGYYRQNLSKSTTEKLEQIAPITSDGKRAVVVRSRLSEVRFSQAAGFYSEPISVRLTAPEGYGLVYYTTDGSDPTSSGTRKKYESAIKLEDTSDMKFGKTYRTGLNYVGNISSSTSSMLGAHVIKACAFNGTNYTGVYTNTYFINPAMAEYGVTVMSVSLETKQMFGKPGFYHNFNPSSNDPNTRGAAFMEVFDENGVRRGYSNVELAISGHGSSGTGMRSMKVFYKGSQNETAGMDSKLNFDLFEGYAKNAKGQCITDFSRLLLRNSGNDCGASYIRDAYMQRVSAGMAAETMAYAPVLVFINGDFWGIYNARERYSADYVESHYGVDKDNVAIIESDYSQVHTNTNAPFIVTSGLDDDADDFNELMKFVRKNDMKDDENLAYVESKLDLDSLIDLFVSRLYFSARDFPENNIKMWRCRAADDPSGADNRWHFCLLDMDMGISFFTDSNNTTENSNYFGWLKSEGSVTSSLIRRLLTNASFKNRFMARFYEVLEEVYVPARMEEALDEIVAQRAPIENLQKLRWGASTTRYNNSIADMRKFVQKRNTFALKYLCKSFGVTENDLLNLGGRYLTVTFSEARLEVSVNGQPVRSPYSLKFDGSVTVTVSAAAKEGFECSAILFTDSDGTTARFSGTTAEITADTAGEISFETKKLAQPAELSVRSGIVAGGCEMFLLKPDGRLYAWGSNRNNVLGAGLSEERVTTPRLVKENVAQVEICHGNDLENGNDNVMAALLTLDGEIYISGASTVEGADTGSSGWTLLEFDGIPVEVSVGYDHLLVLDQAGGVWGLGNNSYGQLGKKDEGGVVTSPRKIADNAVSVSAGRRNSAYIDKNGDCYVLGDGRWNKFRASDTNITTPYKLLSGVRSIASGEHELLLVTEDGSLYYAGWRPISGFTQGTGTAGAEKLSLSGVAKAAIHFGDIAILTESGALYGYGVNNGNCLGGAAVGGVPSLLVKDGVTDVAAGYAFIACLASDGSVRVNGSNSEGQAGNGKISESVSWATAETE